jgi:hypothetical protein
MSVVIYIPIVEVGRNHLKASRPVGKIAKRIGSKSAADDLLLRDVHSMVIQNHLDRCRPAPLRVLLSRSDKLKPLAGNSDILLPERELSLAQAGKDNNGK